ncbi:MAG TPA: hypothetical protein VND45_06050 [Thermoanaerobaculia bacterium]|nr:hypothetical protein [Thermoanaerobaculia bacterium]
MQRRAGAGVLHAHPLGYVRAARDVVESFPLILFQIADDRAPGEGGEQRRRFLRASAAASGDEQQVHGMPERPLVMRVELLLRPALLLQHPHAIGAHAADEVEELLLGAFIEIREEGEDEARQTVVAEAAREEVVRNLQRLAAGRTIAVEQVVDPLRGAEAGADGAVAAPVQQRRQVDRQEDDEVARVPSRETHALPEAQQLDVRPRPEQRHYDHRQCEAAGDVDEVVLPHQPCRCRDGDAPHPPERLPPRIRPRHGHRERHMQRGELVVVHVHRVRDSERHTRPHRDVRTRPRHCLREEKKTDRGDDGLDTERDGERRERLPRAEVVRRKQQHRRDRQIDDAQRRHERDETFERQVPRRQRRVLRRQPRRSAIADAEDRREQRQVRQRRAVHGSGRGPRHICR